MVAREESSVIILVADGLTPGVLTSALGRGDAPALAALRDEGTLAEATTVFPGVTGVAYVPFLMGRFPGNVGLPGLRWYDRRRQLSAIMGHSRSYIGFEGFFIDRDLDRASPTLFELVPGQSLGLQSILRRGLPQANRIDRGAMVMRTAALNHFRGDLRGALHHEQGMAERLIRRIRQERPRFVFAALMGIDKAMHAEGAESPAVTDALRLVDHTVSAIRRDAERDGRWPFLNLWIVSDHGHAPVTAHDDLHEAVEGMGYRVRGHPWVMRPRADMAVMVSGNGMAHLYLELERRSRPFWSVLSDRWRHLVEALLARSSVDLVILPWSPTRVELHGRGKGTAVIEHSGETYRYIPSDGDPLGYGESCFEDAIAALEATAHSPYPDALVQIVALAGAERSGDILVSASPGWDFRSRYEPIAHRSTHGALHREQMRVPLLVNRGTVRGEVRTVDVVPSALRALGLAGPAGLDGRPFN